MLMMTYNSLLSIFGFIKIAFDFNDAGNIKVNLNFGRRHPVELVSSMGLL